MHHFLSSHPNAVPPVVTTGIGRKERCIIHYQPLDESESATSQEDEAARVNFGADIIQSPAPITPACWPPDSPSKGKENVWPSTKGGRHHLKESSFTITPATVEKAKGSSQQVPNKQNFEDRLADATEYIFSLFLASCF